ncbi:peptidoglycan hydrolase-like protein with peptidoglycan-binding domain [Bradyrhizobium sp. AZCC 1719]|uniref:D-Ala-D-Ala carboxypeptidase family metallohydrolase n=1 Tax=Bradyrhizobium sp. AZCC 1719 TaxID=3117028 RepID=UPI002FF3DA8B
MATFIMPDIPEDALPDVLSDLARQPQFQVVKQTRQPNGLFTLEVAKVPVPVAGQASLGGGTGGNAGRPASGAGDPPVGISGAIVRFPTGPFRRPSGPLVMALQLALIKAGQAMEPDGEFGRITCDALRRWQAGQGLPQSNSIDAQQWQTLTGLPAPSLFDVCVNLVSDFEGTGFDRVVGNFDGAGITFGLIGFTLVNGEIRRLLSTIETLRPGSVATTFGALHSELMSVLALSKAEQQRWADGISLGSAKMEVAKPWRDAFQRIGQLPEARRAQMERAYSVYWKAAQQHITDFMAGKPVVDLDAGLWFDVAVQNSLDQEERSGLERIGSSARVGGALREAFATTIAEGSAPRWRKDVLARKMTYAVGQGTVHSSDYQLSDWGLTGAQRSPEQIASPSTIVQILGAGVSAASEVIFAPDEEAGEAASMTGPAVIPVVSDAAAATVVSPHAGWALYTKFVGFVATLGLRHFVADELLFLGNQNGAGSCKGLNEYPPEILWRNIAPTVAVLDKLREELGAPMHFLSLYRAPAYNRCIDGSATNSFHMRYQAIDFVCDVGRPSIWAGKLREYRSRGVFSGGIGVYSSFVHCDTRGVNRDWTG